jgi:predicted cupin superfamily sugar epimerase
LKDNPTTLHTTADWVRDLALSPHPEGGWYRETYRASEAVSGLPDRFGGAVRSLGTAIYFLLADDHFSALHRIRADEVWHYYAGTAPLEVFSIAPDGQFASQLLGLPSTQHPMARPQLWVPQGHWFGSRVWAQHGYALVGCTTAPGFDFADFELAVADTLAAEFPQHAALIQAHCRG